MPFYHRVYIPSELQLIAGGTHCRVRLFLLVAQALLLVLSGHSQEWLCCFSAWKDGLSSTSVKSLREIAHTKNRVSAKVRLAGGALRVVELHWYEAHEIGQRDMKIRRYLDEL